MSAKKALNLSKARALKATLEEAQAAVAAAQLRLSDHFIDSTPLMRDLDDALLGIRKADARFLREIRDLVRQPKKRPNKSPEPTPTAVTPRASEPKSK